MCRLFSCRYPGKTHVHTTEDILLTESEDSFREAAEADSVEDISLTNSFISRVSFMDAIESINTRSCYFCIHVENIYLSCHRSNRRPGMYRCRWLSHLQGVLQGSCQASLYKPGIHVIMFPCMYKECCAVTLPTFLFTDSAENILLGGQAKHFISRISVKEAVDLVYSVQISPNFVAYTHLAIIPWRTYPFVAPTSPFTEPAKDTWLAELDDTFIWFSKALFSEISEAVCGMQIRKNCKHFLHIWIM